MALLATVFSIVFSIALGQFCAGVCLFLFGIAWSRRELRFQCPSVMAVAVPFILLAVILSISGGGLHGLWWRCGKLLWFILIPVTVSLVAEPGRIRSLLLAFLAGCAALGIMDLVIHPILAWNKPVPDYLTSLIDKGSMTDGQMLMLGVVGSTFLMVTLLKEGGRVPWWGWVGLALQGVGLLINFKRGSWFCAMLLVGVALLMQMRWRAWLGALVIVAGIFMLPPVQSRVGQLRREFNVDEGGRLAMWMKVAPALVREHPQGVGYGCLTNDMMRKVFPRVEPNRNHLHSNLIEVLVETGWVGLVLYLVWMFKSFRDGFVWADRAKGISAVGWANSCVVCLFLSGLLMNGLVEYNFGITKMVFIYAIMMGLASAGERHPAESS